MADPQDTTVAEIDWSNYAAAIVAGLAKAYPADTVKDALAHAAAAGSHVAWRGALEIMTEIAGQLGKALAAVEEPFFPVIAGFTAPIVGALFGTEVNPGAFASRASREERNAASMAIVRAFIAAIEGDADGPQEPGYSGTERLAAAGVHAALEGWFVAAVPELLSDLVPFELGHFSAFHELPEEVIRTLGIGRLVRRAMQPIINGSAVEPARLAANFKYRPTKLPVSHVAKLYQSGAWDYQRAYLALAFEGYNDEYADLILKDAAKALSIEDLAWAVWEGILSADDATATMQGQGYDPQTASKHLHVYTLKQQDAIRKQLAVDAIAAYVARRIDDGELDGVLGSAVQSELERRELRNLAAGKRALNTKVLTAAEVAACVKAGILAFPDYVDALEREGYEPPAVDALELLLRAGIDAKLSAAEHRAAQAADRAAKQAARDAAAAEKQRKIDEAKATGKPAAAAVFADAVIRGLIPIEQLETELRKTFDAESVAVYVADVEAKRQAYVTAQQKAADAAKRAANKGLSVGELQAALEDHVLTADQVRARLEQLALSPADVDVLLATMQDRAAQKAAAQAAHAAALAKSKTKRLSIAEADALVLAGHWTQAQYDAYASSIGFSPADVANLDLLLADKLEKQKAGRKLRAARGAGATSKTLSLDQERRAVILGLETTADYAAWLTADGYNADDVATLVAEIEADVTAAATARARRTAAGTGPDGQGVALADLTKAARLGILTPAQYQTALLARGYTPEAAQLELDLLATELAHQGGALPGGAADTSGSTSGSTSPLVAAQARHVTIDGELAARGLSIAVVEDGVKKGELTLDSFVQWLLNNGYGSGDAELLRALLAVKLGG